MPGAQRSQDQGWRFVGHDVALQGGPDRPEDELARLGHRSDDDDAGRREQVAHDRELLADEFGGVADDAYRTGIAITNSPHPMP